ncbi:hypothetical protein [Halobaculum limi]|uniref:hypothetical protein n=1 Tax=Halobaculum limi TaxID=3031916 RepID=UPI0024059120|nr:hypothetical protein [Halobaculum sp. YSMS11]
MEGDDVAYLEAAATVDDRAHSQEGTAAFRDALRRDDDADGVRVLEAGAGTCGMLRRLLADDALPTGEWVATDTDERVLDAGRDLLRAAAAEAGYRVETEGSADVFRRGESRLRVRFVADDARAVAAGYDADGVVGRSFADLLAPEDVHSLLRAAAPDGWYHLPLTFDGETRFSPSHPADDAVLDAFHATMRNRGRAATLVAERFADAGTPPTVDARSDWVVERVGDADGPDDGYPVDEETFLRTILDTVVASVRDSGRVPEATLREWANTREQQLAQGRLGYVAVNRDLFGRVP